MRYLLIRKKGRINNIDAPVVPRIFAMTAPVASNATFPFGVDFPRNRTWIPPDTTNNDPMSDMKLIYSYDVRKSRGVLWSENV